MLLSFLTRDGDGRIALHDSFDSPRRLSMFLSVREASVTASRLQTQRSEVSAHSASLSPSRKLSQSLSPVVRACEQRMDSPPLACLSCVYRLRVGTARFATSMLSRARAHGAVWPCRVRSRLPCGRWQMGLQLFVRCGAVFQGVVYSLSIPTKAKNLKCHNWKHKPRPSTTCATTSDNASRRRPTDAERGRGARAVR